MFDDLLRLSGVAPPLLPKHGDCDFMVRWECLDPQLPASVQVDGSTDPRELSEWLTQRIESVFVSPLNAVSSMQEFGRTGWVDAVPWGFPAKYHFTILEKEPTMPIETSLSAGQHIVQVCLFLVAAIAIFGGSLQFYLGQPDTSARLDNVHRFMAGVYLSTGLICLWAGVTVRQQGVLVYLLALGVLLAGVGRLVSIAKVGLPEPRAVWLGYLIPELVLPFVLAGAHYAGT